MTEPTPTEPTLPAAGAEPAEIDRHWMRLAIAEARDAFSRGDWPTGSLLVRDGHLLATGQNRQVTRGDVTEHAETDAISRAFAAHGPRATDGATLYGTMEPCPMCAGAMKLAGIRRVVLALRHATLRRTDLGAYALEPFCTMTGWFPSLTEGVLQDEYLALRLRWGGDQVAPSGG
jgi:tRNA(adenine34) deaminase